MKRSEQGKPRFVPVESGAPLASPGLGLVLSELLALSRTVSLEMHDEELAHAYVSSMLRLFPGRLFALRLLDAESHELSLVYATGRLRSDRRERLVITARALEEQGLTGLSLPVACEVTESYLPLFSESAEGFDVAMTDGKQVTGVLSVEYPAGCEVSPDDLPRLVPIALSLSASLRNAQLLRESTYLRDYLSKLVEHANAPIVVIGRRREIRVVNRALLSLTGFQRDELVGRELTSWLDEDERARLLPVLVGALHGQSATGVEVRIPSKCGGHVRLLVNTASVLGADGAVEGVIAIGRDLTEIRELERRVVDAEKLASLGQLAAGVVHELNNPLTSISVYSDYLLKQAEKRGESAADALKLRRIHDSADRILRFSRELLAYARPTSEEPTALAANQLIERSLELCDHLIAACGVHVTLDCAENLPPLLGVAPQLQQVFVNLITNACQAMPEGAGELLLATACSDRHELELRITDNGGGISPDHLPRVFDPFFSTKGEGHGTGLGLAIVRNIVEQHHGSIELESELGEGTTFILRFPARGGFSRQDAE